MKNIISYRTEGNSWMMNDPYGLFRRIVRRYISSIFMMAAVCLMLNFSLSAQPRRWVSDSPHEFSVHGGGGYSTLRYDLMQGKRAGGGSSLGGNFGVGYTYFVSEQFGLSTGVGMGLYRSGADLSGSTMVIANLSNPAGIPYELRTTLDDYTERQRAWMVTIPLMLQYQAVQNSYAPVFYMRAGVKLGIPVNARYNVKDATIINARYYPEQDVTLSNRPIEGLGVFSGRSGGERINMGLSWMGSLETGVKWNLSDKLWLYTGIYMDYGLNHPGKWERNQEFVRIPDDDPAAFSTGSVLVSQRSGEYMSGKIMPFSTGITLRLSFGFPREGGAKSGRSNNGIKSIWRGRRPTKAQRRFTAQAIDLFPNRQQTRSQELNFADTGEATKSSATTGAEYTQAIATISQTLEMVDNAQVSGYAVNATTLSATHKKQLDTKIALLKKYPNLNVICEGHTDNSGTHEANRQVGLRRAEAVKKYLVSQGIASSRIQAVSKAEMEPVAPNDTKENRTKNRRVEFKVIEN
jgi:outer membrane protein OmpA-like peptidoglycan-associated protein